MVTITDRSSRSSSGGTPPSIRATPSSESEIFNTAMSAHDMNMSNLRLNSSTPSGVSKISSTSARRSLHFVPETTANSACSSSGLSPFVRVLTPESSATPSIVGTDQPTPSVSSSSYALPPGLTIDFCLSGSTHTSPSSTPFHFTGADDPLPSIEGTSLTPDQSRSTLPHVSPNPTITSPSLEAGAHSSSAGRDGTPTPTGSSISRSHRTNNRAGSIGSQIRQMRISDDSFSPQPENRPHSEERQSRLLSPLQDDVSYDAGRSNASPCRSRPSPGRPRRSSSQLNQAPHQAGDEEPPEDDFNNRVFQSSLTATRELMSRLEVILGSSDLHLEPDSTIRRLRENAGELARFHCPPTRTVGFVGDSGVGKSSLLNSLLDLPGLARASNSGAACTCVVTEYHYHNSPGFRVQVDFFTDDELERQITDLVHAYRRQHLGPLTKDPGEQKDISDRAQVAKDTFDAMFRTCIRYAAGRFVLESEHEEVIVSTMLRWAGDIVGNLDEMADGVTVESLERCSKLLAQLRLTSERHDPRGLNGNTSQHNERFLWPFVKKIKVQVNAHILSKGLILVDLPGLRDLNSARQNITERYILECDEIFAVCCIGRAVTDVGVKTVFDLARKARLSNVGIVCTKSDDINPNEALTDWKGFQEEDDLLDEEMRELERLPLRVISKERSIGNLRFEQDQSLIGTRNKIVKTQLDGLYKDIIPEGNLKVFCVSNKLYWYHRQTARDKALPWLELSGIITLRRHCIALVSNSQLRMAKNYINNDVRALVSSVELWVQSGAGTETAERKALVKETLDLIEKRLKRGLNRRDGPFAMVRRTFVEEFRQQIYSTSYSAFCRNYGNHCTSTIGSRNWNEEAIAKMVRDMTPLWEHLQVSTTEQHPSSAVAAADELIEWAIEYLDNQLDPEDVSTEVLSQALEFRHGLFISDIEGAFRRFKTGLRTMQRNFLSSHRTSLIGESMEDAYNACRRASGTGSDARRKSIVRRTLSDEGLFQDIMDKLCDRFVELSQELQESLHAAVGRNLAAIMETMNILRDENVIAESERDDEFRRRVEDELSRIQRELPARSA
ncbi:hypothetical protein V8F20_005096 [Naviculisporaceae sp. PSN 640]